MGLILSGSNSLLVALYSSRKAAIMNTHHVFFAVGALLGPMIMGRLITHGNLWREGFWGEGLLLLALAALFFFSGGRLPAAESGSMLSHSVGNLFRDRHYRVMLAVNGLSMGVQVAVMLFGVTFLIQAKGCTLAIAGTALSLFSLFMVFGRLVCSRLPQSLRQSPIVLTLLFLQVITLLLAWLGQGWLAITALALSGFTFSGVYPTLLGLVSALFPQAEGSALGILSTMGGLGAVLFCWLSGYLGDRVGMGSSFLVMILAGCAGLLLFFANHHAIARREAQ